MSFDLEAVQGLRIAFSKSGFGADQRRNAAKVAFHGWFSDAWETTLHVRAWRKKSIAPHSAPLIFIMGSSRGTNMARFNHFRALALSIGTLLIAQDKCSVAYSAKPGYRVKLVET
ncbi:MAG TPA: hypothetical protein VGZ47_07160 [Gemmataceae bacterium]|jgi:hypothetical protein|nr:hypothetical protein [Gemmataceae bacterium]